jgi:hypothetical protein
LITLRRRDGGETLGEKVWRTERFDVLPIALSLTAAGAVRLKLSSRKKKKSFVDRLQLH